MSRVTVKRLVGVRKSNSERNDERQDGHRRGLQGPRWGPDVSRVGDSVGYDDS